MANIKAKIQGNVPLSAKERKAVLTINDLLAPLVWGSVAKPKVSARDVLEIRDFFSNVRKLQQNHPNLGAGQIKTRIGKRVCETKYSDFFLSLARRTKGLNASIAEFWEDLDERWFCPGEMTRNRGPKQFGSEFLATFGLGSYNFHEKLLASRISVNMERFAHVIGMVQDYA